MERKPINPIQGPTAHARSLEHTGMTDEEIATAFQNAGGTPKLTVTRFTDGKGSYKPEYCQDLIEFFNKPPTLQVPETWYHSDGSVKRETMREVPNSPPHLGQWAMKVGVWPWVPHVWAKEYPEFNHALHLARSIRKHLVIDNALKGLYNPIFAKLAAANWFGWTDKQEIQHNITSQVVTYHKPEREASAAIDTTTAIEAPALSLPRPKDGD